MARMTLKDGSKIQVSSVIEYPERYAEATRNRIIGNAMKTWRLNTPNHAEVEEILEAKGCKGRDEKTGKRIYADNFYGNIASSFHKYGKLTEKQVSAVLNAYQKELDRIAKWKEAVEEQKAYSKFLGVVSEKRECVLTVDKRINVECPKFHYYDRSSQDIYLMKDEEGNRIILKTKSFVLVEYKDGDANEDHWTTSNDDGKVFRSLAKGDVIKAKFTIKAHTEYKGEKQTVIQRLKVVELLDSKKAD